MDALDMESGAANNERQVLCEKIIRDINAVFLKDADLSSFEIIPKELNCNKSPVVHVEHNLGLESWCAMHVYEHAHRLLIAHRRQPTAQQQRTLQHGGDALAKYLNVALLINPDVTTFWHIRRQLVQKNRLSINRELQFTALVLSKKPKSNEAFAYRRWLYSFQSSDAIDWQNEIGICERAADRRASNYHAWSHRQWVLQSAPGCLLQTELMRTEKFISKHISDYSSYHYRQVVLARAYETGYYVPAELSPRCSLPYLCDLMASLQIIIELQTPAELLQVLLAPHTPTTAAERVGQQRLYSFLYCCNLAAHDMRICEEQVLVYGPRDCFALHRRSALKFIVVHCVRLLTGHLGGLHLPPATAAAQESEFQAQLRKFDYATNPFLAALRRAEAQQGAKHRQWCNIHLGFDYEKEGSAA